jgi:hypothetical protein
VVSQVEMRRNAEVGLTKVDESRNDGDRVWHQMYQLDVVEEEEAAEEVARRDAESVLDVCEDDDGLAGPLGTPRPPPASSRPPSWDSATRGPPRPGSALPSQRTTPRRCTDPELMPSPSSLHRSEWIWI